MYRIFLLRGSWVKKNILFRIETSFFHNVELDELITNQPTCNYPTCTVTEIFESLFSLCIGFILWGGGGSKFVFVQNRNFFFQNVELDVLITNHPTCNCPSCIVTEIFVSLFSLFS